MKKGLKSSSLVIHLIFLLSAVTFVVPLLYIVSISFSSNAAIEQFGYQLWPKEWSFTAYKTIMTNPSQLIDAYKVTLFGALFGGAMSVLVMALIAYPLSRNSFVFKKPITFLIFFTMLFSGGLIPSYLLNTQYLGLGNKIWIYILPGLANAWHIIIMRTFFQQLPGSLVESAKIDGASEMCIFYRIILPLSKPVFATVFLMVMLTKWNDWTTSLYYIRDAKLYSLQYMLQRILREIEFVKTVTDLGLNVNAAQEVAAEPVRFAMVILAAGPMLVVFPFFQKYFTKGLTVGSVKG